MEYFKYAELSRSTASPEEFMCGSTNQTKGWADFLHGVLGIVSETAELAEAIEDRGAVGVAEEAGDVFWFIASCVYGLFPSASHCCLMDADEMFNNLMQRCMIDAVNSGILSKKGRIVELSDLTEAAAYLADEAKSTLAYRKEEHFERGYAALSKYTKLFLQVILIHACGSDTFKLEAYAQQLMAWNLLKLKKRFGDKFTPEARALIDKENELSHMS